MFAMRASELLGVGNAGWTTMRCNRGFQHLKQKVPDHMALCEHLFKTCGRALVHLLLVQGPRNGRQHGTIRHMSSLPRPCNSDCHDGNPLARSDRIMRHPPELVMDLVLHIADKMMAALCCTFQLRHHGRRFGLRRIAPLNNCDDDDARLVVRAFSRASMADGVSFVAS